VFVSTRGAVWPTSLSRGRDLSYLLADLLEGHSAALRLVPYACERGLPAEIPGKAGVGSVCVRMGAYWETYRKRSFRVLSEASGSAACCMTWVMRQRFRVIAGLLAVVKVVSSFRYGCEENLGQSSKAADHVQNDRDASEQPSFGLSAAYFRASRRRPPGSVTTAAAATRSLGSGPAGRPGMQETIPLARIIT